MTFDPLTELNTLPELVRMAWKVYKEKIILYLFSPILFILLLMLGSLSENFPNKNLGGLYLLFWLPIFLAALVFIFGIYIKTAEQTVMGKSVDFKQITDHVYACLFRALGATLRLLLDILLIRWFSRIEFGGGGFEFTHEHLISKILQIVALVAILFLLSFYQFINQLVILNDGKGSKVQKQSGDLVIGQWWHVNGKMLVVTLILGIILWGSAQIAGLIAPGYGLMVFMVLFPFALPILSIFRTLLFLNLEARQGMAPWQQTPAEVIEPSA